MHQSAYVAVTNDPTALVAFPFRAHSQGCRSAVALSAPRWAPLGRVWGCGLAKLQVSSAPCVFHSGTEARGALASGIGFLLVDMRCVGAQHLCYAPTASSGRWGPPRVHGTKQAIPMGWEVHPTHGGVTGWASRTAIY